MYTSIISYSCILYYSIWFYKSIIEEYVIKSVRMNDLYQCTNTLYKRSSIPHTL